MSEPEHITPAEEAPEDLGFGKALTSVAGVRLVNRDGTFNVLRNRRRFTDLFSYSTMLNLRWPGFIAYVVLIFFLLNALFAVFYMLCGVGALATSGPALHVSRFWQALIFSIDTFSTIGYGNIVPVGHLANFLVALEAIIAVLNTALVTGLVFARFSRPNVRIEFSRSGVVRIRDKPAILIRLRNLTRSELLEVEATLVAWFKSPADGKLRRFYPLPLERARITFLPLSWTIAHFITPESPFFNLSEEQFRQSMGEVMLQVRAVDQTSSQIVYARVSYTPDEMAWAARFKDQYTHDRKTGTIGIDTDRFHETEPE